MIISLKMTDELEMVAKKVVWFLPPEEAIKEPINFIAHVLTYGTHEDVKVLKKQINNDQLKFALDNAPPGVMDSKSWSYWNLMLGRHPAPPEPKRTFN